MRINIELTPANLYGLANIYICYKEPATDLEKKVQLKVEEFFKLYDFTQDTTSLGFDFFLISAIVYGIDDLFARDKYSFNGWTRELEVILPVNNIDEWNSAPQPFSEALSFLTGDQWTVTFRKLTETIYVESAVRLANSRPQYDFNDYSFASLFSGGLDSLIGVINELDNLETGKKGIFISHYDSIYKGPKGDQIALINKLDRSKIDYFRTMVGLSNIDNLNNRIKRDGNQRARSILFLGLGCYLSTNANIHELIMPENGTISLNHPLTPSRSSSLSTRTTHPFFIDQLHIVFNLVGIDLRIKNPFSFSTKGEMVVNCTNRTLLTNTYADSASCGKRRPQPRWDVRGAKQCGTCMPCIYRRASLHRLNLDNEVFGKDLLNQLNPINASKEDMSALFDYLNSNLTLEKIKRNLIVNGNIPQVNLIDYAKVVERSRNEILAWISAKGNRQIKDVLRLR